MATALILTANVEHLASGLKRKMRGAGIFLLAKNKDGQNVFPDGESYVRLSQAERLKSKRVVVLCSGAPNQDKSLVELELLLHILKENKIRPEVFFTYFPYSQQDKVFLKGEANAAESLVKKLFSYYGVKKIHAIDLHFANTPWVKKYPLVNVSSAPLLMEKAKEEAKGEMLFMSPDKGGRRRTGISGLNKKRVDSFNVEMTQAKADLKGKSVGVVDDILETGGTLARFCDTAKGSGAKTVTALITHGPCERGILRVKKKFADLYLTNTINTRHANVDVTDLIIEALNN